MIYNTYIYNIHTQIYGHIIIYTYTCMILPQYYIHTMYVCTCMYMYVQYTQILTDTHTHTYIHKYIHTYIHTHTHTYIHTYILTDTHTHIHKYIHTYIHTYTHTYIIHKYIHTYIHTYTHTTYIHTYLHTHIHTHTDSPYKYSTKRNEMFLFISTVVQCIKSRMSGECIVIHHYKMKRNRYVCLFVCLLIVYVL